MRMKFNKSSQLLLVSAASLLVASLVTACGTLTVDFVFVTSSKAAGPDNYGEVDVFEVNSQSGHMRQIPTSPFPSGGRNPVAEAVSSNDANLYVVNQDDNTIVQFVIGNDGKLYPVHTVNTPGIFPMAIAVNGLNVFVVDSYQPLPTCSTAAPCSGSIAVFPTTVGSHATASEFGQPVANGSLNYWPLTLPGKPSDVIVPTAVNVLASGAAVYVTAYDSSVTPNAGFIFGFAVGSTGALAPLNGGLPYAAGIFPSAIASDPTSHYVYVTDLTSGNILGYSVQSGALSPLSGSPFPAGNQPSAILVDPAGSYAYVTNSKDSNLTTYSLSNGALTRLSSYATGLQPVAVGVDPSTKHFIYTVNFLGGNLSGFELTTTGTLLITQFSPFATNAQPTSVAAIPHGSLTK
jgi:6-phosphogluconolactonase